MGFSAEAPRLAPTRSPPAHSGDDTGRGYNVSVAEAAGEDEAEAR